MTEYDDTNRGKLWRNKKKDPNSPDFRESLADFTGELDIDGVKYFVDAWKRKPEANPLAPALSFKVKRKDKQPQPIHSADPQPQPSISQRAQATVRPPDDRITSGPQKQSIIPVDMDDDIPF